MKSAGPEVFRRRLVGLYALTLMDREGPLHGYALSERIARATEGAWRPGPGSVYPSLQKLVQHRLAVARREERRRTYRITPAGRTLLRGIRGRHGVTTAPRADLSPLWAEVAGSTDVGEFLVERLHRTLDRLDALLQRRALDVARHRRLREAVLSELTRAMARLDAAPDPPRRPVRRTGGPRGS